MDYEVAHEQDLVTFRPPSSRARVLFVPFATDAELVDTVLRLEENQHHAWGVKELLADSIEVSVLDQTGSRLDRLGLDWRLPESDSFDAVYCNHNGLVRSPIESLTRRRATPLISLVYAGEPLCLPRQHTGILAMTPRAERRFVDLDCVDVRLAPWGVDPTSALHQRIEPSPEHFVSTGVTKRDFATLFEAARTTSESIVLSARGTAVDGAPANVRVISELKTPWDIRDLYTGAVAGLVVLERDDKQRSSVGWTNVLELMAVGLPIIKTRTGTLDEIVDLEAIGAGLLVEPDDPAALADAMRRLRDDPALCRSMGNAGATYVREHLTMDQFAKPLIEMIDLAAQR